MFGFGYLKLAMIGALIAACLSSYLFYNFWQNSKFKIKTLEASLVITKSVLKATQDTLSERDDVLIKLNKESQNEQTIINQTAMDKCFDSAVPDVIVDILR